MSDLLDAKSALHHYLQADPQADWYATDAETCVGLVDLYRRVWTFADATIDELPLDALDALDGGVGLRPGRPNVPEGRDWTAYVARLTALAERP